MMASTPKELLLQLEEYKVQAKKLQNETKRKEIINNIIQLENEITALTNSKSTDKKELQRKLGEISIHVSNVGTAIKVEGIGSAGTGNLAYTHNMVENPSPLAETNPGAAATFRSGMYNVEILQRDTIFYRVGKAGGGKNALGQYFTRKPISRTEGRIDLAIKPQWIDPSTGKLTGTSPLDSIYAIKIPKGTPIYEGPAANQGGIYTGGGIQIFISEPWKIKGVEPISETPLK